MDLTRKFKQSCDKYMYIHNITKPSLTMEGFLATTKSTISTPVCSECAYLKMAKIPVRTTAETMMMLWKLVPFWKIIDYFAFSVVVAFLIESSYFNWVCAPFSSLSQNAHMINFGNLNLIIIISLSINRGSSSMMLIVSFIHPKVGTGIDN